MPVEKLWYGSFDTGPSHVNSEGTNTQPQKIATLIISHYSNFKAPIPTIANAIEPIATNPLANELKGTHKNFATNARLLSPLIELGSMHARMFAYRSEVEERLSCMLLYLQKAHRSCGTPAASIPTPNMGLPPLSGVAIRNLILYCTRIGLLIPVN